MSGQIYSETSISLDGFSAGPNDTPANGLGDNGESLHEWIYRLRAWRERHGMQGGETDADDALIEEFFAPIGAVVMGRRMFDHGFAPWGETPPFHAPVFVVTHRPQPPIIKLGGTTFHFVDDGLESAIRQAREAAGERDVNIAGGASVVQQALRAGMIDRMQIHIAPVLLGGGVRLFDDLGAYKSNMVVNRIVASPHVAHFLLERKK